MDRQQGFALIAEMTSARNLLAYGVHVVRTGAFLDTTRDPILTMLSVGMEKLYKLTLGLDSLDTDGRWPSKAAMKKLGHGLEPMHDLVMTTIRRRTWDSSPYVRGLIAEVEGDPCVLPIIRTLDVYGRMGRFYYLDKLGDTPQAVNPEEIWDDVEQAARTDPAVAALFARAMADVSDNAVWDELTRALHDRIADSVERIWTTIAVVGRNRALGETGRVFGFEIHPHAVGRQQ